MSAPAKTSPTPTPWHRVIRDYSSDAGAIAIVRGNAVYAPSARGDDDADAELIVRAVNSHEALVEALARLERRVDELLRKRLAAPMDLAGIATTAGLDDACANARAALAKAGAK